MKRLPILFLFNLCLMLMAAWLVSRIALTTRFNAHPDEYDHLAAFCYFEQSLWPPDLNTDGLVYNFSGWNRAYTAELIYPLFARLSGPMEAVMSAATSLGVLPAELVWSEPEELPVWSGIFPPECARRFMIYRFINIGLLLGTLSCLFWWGRKQPWLTLLGLTMLSIPQVIYLYSYANNDAWALSLGTLLFAFALTQRHLLSSWRKQVVFGLLLGVMLLSKPSLWAVLPFVAWPILRNALEDYPDWGWREWRRPVLQAAVVTGLVALLLVTPLKIIYPLSQGDFAAQEYQMRLERAAPSFRPDAPTENGLYLAKRGVSFREVLLNRDWYRSSSRSFYAWFGYFSVRIHAMIYRLIFLLWTLNLVIPLLALVTKPGSALPRMDKALFLVAPLAIGLNVLVSLYYSWSFDFQPQGRYLFGAVAPLALLLWGTIPWESKWFARLRMALLIGLALFSQYILWFYVVLQPDKVH